MGDDDDKDNEAAAAAADDDNDNDDGDDDDDCDGVVMLLECMRWSWRVGTHSLARIMSLISMYDTTPSEFAST
jgi:hypothetical protein